VGEECFRRKSTSEGSAAGVKAQALLCSGDSTVSTMKVETQARARWQKDIHNFLNIPTTF